MHPFRIFILTCILFLGCFPGSSVKGQIGFSSGLMSGNDAERFDFSSAYTFKLGWSHKIDAISGELCHWVVQPSVRFQGYNIGKPLVADRWKGTTVFRPDENPTHVYKDQWYQTSNRMSLHYVNLTVDPYFPLNEGENKNTILLSPGFFVEYQIGGRFKRRYYKNGDEHVVKMSYKAEDHYYGLQRWQYGVQLEAKWKFITLFANHSLSTLFKKNEGPELRRSTAGIYFFFLYDSHTF